MLRMTQDHKDLMEEGIIALQFPEQGIVAGDTVRTGPNFHPHYLVIATFGDTAWVQNVETGTQALTALSRCSRLSAAAPTSH